MRWVRRWFWNVLIAVDQLGNAVTGGDPDETISSRLGKRVRSGEAGWFARFTCWSLGWIDRGHCRASIEEDEGNDAV